MDSSAEELECLKRTATQQREEIEELKVRVTTLEQAQEQQKWGHNLITPISP